MIIIIILFCANWFEFGEKMELLMAYDFRNVSKKVKSLFRVLTVLKHRCRLCNQWRKAKRK